MLSSRDADSAAASPRLLVGAMVRYYRTRAGMSQDQLGGRVYLTGDMVSGNGGNCVEVGSAPRAVAVRDSKNPDGPKLAFSREGWRRFTLAVKSGAERA